jgi:hypothetical protein
VLPWIDQAGLNGVALELSRKADTIATTRQAMRAGDAAAKVTPPIARLRSSLLCEIILETPDVGDGLDLGGDAEPRSAQRIYQIAIADEHDMGMQLRSGLEDPRAVRRKAMSCLLPCDPFLILGDLLPAGSSGCGQPPEFTSRSRRSLHLMTCTMKAPEFGSGHTMRRDCAGHLYQLHKRDAVTARPV